MDAPQEPTGEDRGTATGESEATEVEPLQDSYRLIELSRGASVGRYSIVRRVGAGAMGVVYEAHDPSLDRTVAIKVLRKRPVDPNETAVGEARLLREARALARLSHPNVVPVYDVGVTESGGERFIFIAMEFVRGKTMRAWVKEGRRPAKILSAMKAAGRGLAAAHAAGLVHRDFKLDNAIIDEHGRVRVMDFGLARPQTELDEQLDSSTAVDSVANLGATLTQEGTVMGTPVYMSPEQHVGRPLDARSDQFSFCVALYEALYAKRPYVGATTRQLARAKLRGRVRKPPSNHAMSDLFVVIERGLLPNPNERWASMGPLLRRLKPVRKRSLIGAALAGGAVAGVVALMVYYVRTPDPCDGADEHIADVWSAKPRRAVRNALGDGETEYARDTIDLTVARLDAYAEAWAVSWESTCRAGQDAAEDTGARVDRQALCLDHRKAELATAFEVIMSLEESNVGRGPYMVATLNPPESCVSLDGATTLDDEPPADSLAAEAHRLQRRALVRARAGQYAVALGEAYAALTLAAASGHERTVAKAELRVGATLSDWGQFALAETMLTSAIWRAESADDDATAASAAAHLIFVVGVRMQRFDDAMRWARLGRAFAERIPEDPERLAHILENEANALDDFGHRPEALLQMRRVLEIREKRPPSERSKLAMTLNNLGLMLMNLAEYDEAREHLDRSLALRKEVLGPAHPDTGMSYLNLASLAAHLERYEESLELSERGLRIYKAAVGDVHPSVASAMQLIAANQLHLGEYDSAVEVSKRLIETREQIYGPNHAKVATGWANLGAVYANTDQLDKADEALAKALAVYSVATSEETELCGLYHNLATVSLRRGKWVKAEELYKRSLELWERGYGQGHTDLSYPLSGMGELMLERGQLAAARPYLERAKRLTQDLEHSPRLAQIDFWLAQSLWLEPKDRERAWALAKKAEQSLKDSAGGYQDEYAKLIEWMNAHRDEAPTALGD